MRSATARRCRSGSSHDRGHAPPGRSAPSVVETGEFPEVALFGRTASVVHAVLLPIGHITVVELDGTLTALRSPWPAATSSFEYLDDTDTPIGEGVVKFTASPDGSYAVPFLVPHGTATAVCVALRTSRRSLPRNRTRQPRLGANARGFDAVYDPPVAVIVGEAINGFVPNAPCVSIDATRPDASVVSRPEVTATPDPDTGRYSVSVILPIGTTAADVTAWAVAHPLTERTTVLTGTGSWPERGGSRCRGQPRCSTLSGTITENGAALPGRFDVRVTATTADGPQVFTVR